MGRDSEKRNKKMTIDAAIALALEALSKMTQESEQLVHRKELVAFFCLRAIPRVVTGRSRKR